MKKLLTILLLVTGYCQAQVKVAATGNIIPTGLYPAVNNDDLRGTIHDVQSLVERNAIPANFRIDGMMAFVKDSLKFYYLSGGILNTNWLELGTGGGTGGNDSAFIAGHQLTDTSFSLIRINGDSVIFRFTGTGGGSETWEQTLQTQGSTPFTTDNTVDFGGHLIEFDNSGFDLYNDSTEFYIDKSNLYFQKEKLINDTIVNTSIVLLDSTIRLGANRQIAPSSYRYYNLDINPSSVTFSTIEGISTDTVNTILKVKVDSSNADPNNIAWFDNQNILHRGHITTSGGISKLGISPYGLIKLNDSTYTADSSLLLTKLGAASLYQPIGSYLTANQPITVTATGDATGTSSSSGTAPSIALTLANTTVTPGSYTNTNLTVDSKGRLTAVSNGSGGGGGTVSSLHDSTANGVAIHWVNPTTLAAPVVTLGNITPTSVTTNSFNLLPQATATLPPATGNVIFDSSGLNYRASSGVTINLTKTLLTANQRDSFQNKSGQIALLRDSLSKFTNDLGFISNVTQTYTSGSSITANNLSTWLIVNPASIVSALTITLAASPADGQKVDISFGGTVTAGNGVINALTVSPNSGQSLIQSSTPDYMQSGSAISYKYNSSNTSWYRIN